MSVDNVWMPENSLLTQQQGAWLGQPLTYNGLVPVAKFGLDAKANVAEFDEEVLFVDLKDEFVWLHEYDNVLGLAFWLNEQCWFDDTSAMLSYFEKPQRWEREYFLWRAADNNPEHAEEFWEAVADNDITARVILLKHFPVGEQV